MNSETKLFGGIFLATIAIVGGTIFFLSRPSQSATQKADAKYLLGEHSYKISSPSATATLVEFGDYQCPACGAYHPMIKQVLKDFLGSLDFVFREYPLQQHANAPITARAAQAAGLQGKYYEMHDVLYEKQSEWAEEDAANAKMRIFTYAKNLGLDMEKFTADIESDTVKGYVSADVRDGDTLGVNATPTFYLNGIKLENPASLADFEATIRKAIKDGSSSSAK